jgi:uncharacterized protein (TIGR03083 family)
VIVAESSCSYTRQRLNRFAGTQCEYNGFIHRVLRSDVILEEVPMEYLVPRSQAFDLFQRTSRRVERTLSTLTGQGIRPARKIPHLAWTVGEMAVHLVQGVEIASELLEGKPSPYSDMHRIAEVNAELLSKHESRQIDDLVPRFSRGVRQMEGRFREMPDDFAVPFHGGLTFTPAQAMAMMSSELMIHGWDLAQVTKEDWEIDAEDARLILYTITPIMPHMVIPEAAKGLTATYEICLDGGACFRLHFEDGELSVSHVEPGGPADCRISADPSAFLLLGYGRGSQLMPMLTRKVRAGGRKPWLAAKFTSLFKNP